MGRSGFTTLPEQDGFLPVEYEGRRLCRVNADGSVFYHQDDVTTLDREAACRRVTDSAAIVQEYMTLLERASILNAAGLHEPYRALVSHSMVTLYIACLGSRFWMYLLYPTPKAASTIFRRE